ncbi:MAG: hypothetical protein GX432_09470 [Candidatus Atribacteria bacterium]|nr:hypothetical protein [Candidatus Atribacteria bacterium]
MNEPRLIKIVAGWSAHGDGWAVHASTKEAAIQKFKERKKFYEELKGRPFWYENPENPNHVTVK